MKKLVVFCESYPQIKNALYIATCNSEDHSTTLVITGNRDLFTFFHAVNERVLDNSLDIIYVERYQRRTARVGKIAKPFCVLSDIIGQRRHLQSMYRRHFHQMRGAHIYFFSREWASGSFFFLKRLSRANTLVYMAELGCASTWVDTSRPTTPIDLAKLIAIKLIFGRDALLGKSFHTRFPSMPDKFFEKAVDEVIGPSERDRMMKDFDFNRFRVFDIGKYRVIYFDEDLIESGYLSDSDTFLATLSRVFDILAKYFPQNEIARKYRPSAAGNKALIGIGDILDDFIPAELLRNENTKVYMSTLSTSIANMESGVAISLIDLCPFKNEQIRQQLKRFLIQFSSSEILFPKSFDEFERIVEKASA